MVLLAVVGVAAAVRLAWALHATRPVTVMSDPAVYRYLADRLATGKGYTYLDDLPSAYYPPGYPFALAGFQWLLDRLGWDLSPQTRMSALNFLPSVLTVGLTWGIARRVLDRTTAAVAAGIVALWPNLVFFVAIGFTETIFLFLTMASIWVLMAVAWTPETLSGRRLAAFGAMVGAAALVRPLTIPLLVFLPFALRSAGFSWRDSGRKAAIAAGAAALVLAPWAVRNTRTFDTPVIVSTNMGDNLCIGRSPEAFGGYNLPERCIADDGVSEPDNDRDNTITAVRYALGHPLTELKLSFWRAYYTYHNDHDGLSDTPGYLDVPEGGYYRYRFMLADAADAYCWIVVALAMLVLPRAWRSRRGGDPRRRFLLMTAVWLALTPLVFFGQSRFKIPAVPLLAIGAAATLVTLARAWKVSTVHTPEPAER